MYDALLQLLHHQPSLQNEVNYSIGKSSIKSRLLYLFSLYAGVVVCGTIVAHETAHQCNGILWSGETSISVGMCFDALFNNVLEK